MILSAQNGTRSRLLRGRREIESAYPHRPAPLDGFSATLKPRTLSAFNRSRGSPLPPGFHLENTDDLPRLCHPPPPDPPSARLHPRRSPMSCSRLASRSTLRAASSCCRTASAAAAPASRATA